MPANHGPEVLADFGEQSAAYQVSMFIVDQFEMVQVDKDETDAVLETARTLDLRLQGSVEMANVVKTRTVVGDGEFLNAFDGAGIFDRNGRVIA